MMDIRATALLAQARQMQQLCRVLCQEADELRRTSKKLRGAQSFLYIGLQLKRRIRDIEEEALKCQQMGQVLLRAAELSGKTENRLVVLAEGSRKMVCPSPPRETVTEERNPLLDFCK